MSELNQKTINSNIKIEGIGLHTGKTATLTLKPAEPNSGIIFKRIDLKNENIIFPNVYNVSNASFCTTISNNSGATVSTIEHLMGALYGTGVDNVLIEIDNQEVPILDGSAKIFVEKILEVGLKVSEAPIKIIRIEKEVEFSNKEKNIVIKPSKLSLDIDFGIKYENQFIGSQRNKIDMYKTNLRDIYNSRTFCLYEDIESLRSNNLALGGSLENAIVVKGDEILNDEKLRNEKEFVNHKILDCMGDLYLSGYKIIGSIICSQGGHMLTNQLLRKLFSDNSNFSIIEVKEKIVPSTVINKQHLRSIA